MAKRIRPVVKPQAEDPARREIVERWIHLYRSGEWEKEVAEIICADEKSLKKAKGLLGMPMAAPSREKPTPAELLVVECLCQGLHPGEIATLLGKSLHTIRHQLKYVKGRTAAKTTDHLVAICLREGWAEEPESPAVSKPRPAELRVIECLSHGLGTEGTADVLFLSKHTVKSHLKNAKTLVGCKTREHLISICLREGWIN